MPRSSTSRTTPRTCTWHRPWCSRATLPPTTSCSSPSSRRLHLVPRYRQRLAFVPLGPGPAAVGRRPAPEPALPRARHGPPLPRRRGPAAGAGGPRVRPAAGSRQAAVGALAGRWPGGRPLRAAVQDPPRAGGRRVGRGHHVACCSTPHPSPPRRPDPGRRWLPRPLPSQAELLGEALLERATVPGEAARTRACRVPRAAADRQRAGERRGRRWSDGLGGPQPRARAARTTATIGPHRRFTWVRTDLADVKAIKNELGGTVNDVVLASVAGALGRHLRRRGQRTDGLELKAMVPVSVRAEAERGRPGQQGGRDDGAAAGVVPGAGRAPGHRARADEGAQGERPGGRAPRCSPTCPASPPRRSWRRPRA